jgi:PAS domain S-box-containing protein
MLRLCLTGAARRRHGEGVDSLRVRLMLLAAVALLPLAGLVLYNSVSQRHQAAADAEDDALKLVLTCANDEERMVDSANQMLVLMAEIPGVRNMDAEACGPVFARVIAKERGISNLGLLNANGVVVASAKPVALAGPLGARTFFKTAFGLGQFAESDFELEPNKREAEMICGEPVRGADGRIEGVVFAEMNLTWMTDINTRLGLPAAETIGVVGADGTILMRVPDAADYVGKSVMDAPAGRMIMQRRGSGVADEEGLDHVRRLFAFAPLDPVHGLGAFVSAGIPDEIAFSGPRRSERRQIAMLAVFALGTFLAAWFAADILVLRGVRKLLRATQKVASGDLKTRAGPMFGGKEFRELAQAFDTMAGSLEKQSGLRDAAEQELEKRVEQRTAELGEANTKLQEEVGERSRIEAQLRLSNERLDLALRGTTDGIWDWDLVTGQMYFSPRWKEMLGYRDDEIGDRFKEWETRLHPEDRDRALGTIRDYFGGKRATFELEHRLRHKDGSYRWILSRGVAVWDENGKPKRMAGSHQDLTERRRAEQALRESESKLRAFITNVPAILFSIDRTGVITMAEGLGMDVLKFVEGGIVGHSVAELYGDMPGVVESVKRALAGESLVTTMQLQQIYFEVAYSPIHAPDGTVTGVIGVAHDVTVRHKAEQALEISERRMRLIIENAYDAYVAMDREGMIVDWNPQAERVFGWSREEAMGRLLSETIIPERMREQHMQGLVHYLHTGEGPVLNRRIEMQALRRDGKEFPVEMTISTMQIEKTVIFSAFIHDISDRIRAKEELERTAAELRRSNEELEQFAYIASHDLQEPLRMVASYTQLLERRYAGQLDEPAREFIGYAVDGARRMQGFITGLLKYSRVGTEPQVMQRVDLREMFEAAIANLRIAIEESGATVEARDLPVVQGDTRMLTQLLQNLIGNALKFRKPGAQPHVEVWAEREGDFWRISVRDNGIGMDPQFSDRVFTIFQRLHTRDEYEGTGLGLAICKKIVERHGGRIWVESKEGEGATFSFTLPGADTASHEHAQG